MKQAPSFSASYKPYLGARPKFLEPRSWQKSE